MGQHLCLNDTMATSVERLETANATDASKSQVASKDSANAATRRGLSREDILEKPKGLLFLKFFKGLAYRTFKSTHNFSSGVPIIAKTIAIATRVRS